MTSTLFNSTHLKKEYKTNMVFNIGLKSFNLFMILHSWLTNGPNDNMNLWLCIQKSNLLAICIQKRNLPYKWMDQYQQSTSNNEKYWPSYRRYPPFFLCLGRHGLFSRCYLVVVVEMLDETIPTILQHCSNNVEGNNKHCTWRSIVFF